MGARPSYDQLSRPLPAWHPRAWYYAALAAGLRSIGRLSAGVDLGYRAGFDSGLMMEYVYANRPQGRGPIGRFIDRVFLNAVGWRGIRRRKENLKAALAAALLERRQRGERTVIVDLAAGTGRYLLETLAEHSESDVEAVLRDLSGEGLTRAREIAAELGVRNVRFETGDAFSRSELQALTPRPDVVVVSGLYEILPDDDLVRPHFALVREILSSDGVFIHTAQPHHPQLELIARTLVNREGKPWVMRLRSLETLEGWAREGGFTRFERRTDRWEIFHVITARP
jgi:SAM-dependent methyltransferase